MHAFVYVIIGPTGNINDEVAQALAPFDENLEVEPYKMRIERGDVRIMADHYGLPEDDLPALAEKLPDWFRCDGGVDELGLFSWSTVNPDGRWDWYIIGGRWAGCIHGKPTRRDPYDQHQAAQNVTTTGELLNADNFSDRLPHAVVTPAGEWLEQEQFVQLSGRFGIYRRPDDQWLPQVRRVLETYPRHRVVGVDVHH